MVPIIEKSGFFCINFTVTETRIIIRCTRVIRYIVGLRYRFPTVNRFDILPAGHIEHFADKCGGVPAWLDKNTYYTAFTEGWGLYSENPILSDDTDTYKDNLLQKYGMLKWQVSRSEVNRDL